VSITFDDGYRDNLEVAMPILQRHALTATFFIATGFLDGGIMMHDTAIEAVRRMPSGSLDLEWVGLGQRHINDMSSRSALIADFVGRVKYMALAPRRAACERLAALSPAPLPRDLMMSSAQVRQMHDAGMHIGAHTHDHPILAQQSLAEAREQIGRNREVLTQLIGSVPRLFAYPNGKPKLDYSDEHVALVKQAGFEAAVSVSFGTVTRDSDHFQIPRFIPWDSAPAKVAFRVLTHPLRYPAPQCA
jgi:peptidoglycan/xylan/chitin deacetylase (PgdA/CDA1 family)